MGLDAIVRAAVTTANSVTASLQATVTHECWTGADSDSKPTYATGVARQAVVSLKQRLRRLPDGQEVVQQAAVTFVGPIAPNGATGRREPVDPRDRIVLPDGTTGPILDVRGVADPSTGRPYAITVALGRGGAA